MNIQFFPDWLPWMQCSLPKLRIEPQQLHQAQENERNKRHEEELMEADPANTFSCAMLTLVFDTRAWCRFWKGRR